MAFVQHVGGGPQRFGATVLDVGSGCFKPAGYRASVADLNQSRIDRRFLRDGLTIPQPAASGDYGFATATDAKVVIPAPGVGKRTCLFGVTFGYLTTPNVSGSFQITDGSGNVVFHTPVTAAGPQSILWEEPKKFSENAEVICQLNNAGAGVRGEVSLAGKSVVGVS
jgi:hypothetical protein